MRRSGARDLGRAVCFLACAAAAALAPALLRAQVPAPLAAQNRALGDHLSLAAALRIYAPQEERPPYHGVHVRRHIAYGAGAHERLDLFVPVQNVATASGAPRLRPVLVLAAPESDERRGLGGGQMAYDNVALWAVRHGGIGVILRRRDDASPWPSGAQDFAAMLAWLQAQVRSAGGDPQRVLVMGVGSAATQLLSYLAHHEYWCCRGPGVAAAALLSAPLNLAEPLPGPTRTLLDPTHSDLPGLDSVYAPIFIGSAQYESDAARRSAITLQQQLCRRGRCPTVRYFVDHNALSALLSFDTTDDSVSRQLLAWLQSRHP